MSSASDRRRLAPRTSEDEALFIAKKYAQNKLILEAKLANSLNGGRLVRQTMLDDVANELSVKFNVASRSRKYVEQKLRDMKKEARKFYYLQQNAKLSLENIGNGKSSAVRAPSEPIRVMIEAMTDELRAGVPASDDYELYEKSIPSYKTETMEYDTEHDGVQSRQSVASSSGESHLLSDNAAEKMSSINAIALVDGIPSQQSRTVISPTNLSNNNTGDSEKPKCSTIIDALPLSWQTAYNQSLSTFLMGLSNAETFPLYSFNNDTSILSSRSNHSSKSDKSDSVLGNSGINADGFVAVLRQMMEGVLGDTHSMEANNGKDCTGMTEEIATRELLKTFAASSLFLPNLYFQPPADALLTAGGLLNPTTATVASALQNVRSQLSNRKTTQTTKLSPNMRQKKNEDTSSNPCSPFNHLTNSTESLRQSSSNFDSEVNHRTRKRNPSKFAEKLPEDAEMKKCIDNENMSHKRHYSGIRLRHCIMRNSLSTNATSNKNESTSTLGKSRSCFRFRNNSLAALERRLLIEELKASRAFTALCEEIQKSVGEAKTSFIKTHQLHSQLLRAQLQTLGIRADDNNNEEDDKITRKRKCDSREMYDDIDDGASAEKASTLNGHV